MKIGIYYFSGTGNTKFVADKLCEKLSAQGNKVEVSSIEKTKKVSEDLDMIIIGGPIYATNMPEKLIRWVIRNVPDSNQKLALVYSTSAVSKNAFGVDSLAKKLFKKGYSIIGKSIFIMPRNFYFGSFNKNSDEETKSIIEQTSQKITQLSKEINEQKFQVIDESKSKVFTKDLLAELFSVMAKFMGKSFSVDDKCTKCGLCIKNCPQKNISFEENKIKYSSNCMLCSRCIHICPVNAINYKSKKYEQYKI